MINADYTQLGRTNIFYNRDYMTNYEYNRWPENKLIRNLLNVTLPDTSLMKLYINDGNCILRHYHISERTGIFIDYIFFNDLPDYVGVYIREYRPYDIKILDEKDTPYAHHQSLYNLKTNRYLPDDDKVLLNFFNRHTWEVIGTIPIRGWGDAGFYTKFRHEVIDNIYTWKFFIDQLRFKPMDVIREPEIVQRKWYQFILKPFVYLYYKIFKK